MIALLALLAASGDLQVVPKVDLNRYQGRWYEIARLPNRFERKCVSDVTATYSLKPDGKVRVVNECREADGGRNVADGTAKVRDKNGPNSRLRVTFFWPFYGDYQIMQLDPEYRWVLVGTPDRKYLWILSRTPKLEKPVIDRLLGAAKTQGFNVSPTIYVKHGG